MSWQARKVLVSYCQVLRVEVRCDRYGAVWLGKARCELVGQGVVRQARLVMDGLGRFWHGTAGESWSGLVRIGELRHGTVSRVMSRQAG